MEIPRSLENEIGRRTIAYSLSSSEPELKAPFVLIIYAALPRHYFTFLFVRFVGRIEKAFN